MKTFRKRKNEIDIQIKQNPVIEFDDYDSGYVS